MHRCLWLSGTQLAFSSWILWAKYSQERLSSKYILQHLSHHKPSLYPLYVEQAELSAWKMLFVRRTKRMPDVMGPLSRARNVSPSAQVFWSLKLQLLSCGSDTASGCSSLKREIISCISAFFLKKKKKCHGGFLCACGCRVLLSNCGKLPTLK